MKRYSGKHTRASAPRRGLVLAAALALTLIFSAGGTLAWLAASTEETVNTFSPAQMEIEVKEKFDGEIKQNVRVENKSETAVYIRVALVPTWVNAEGEPMAQSASLDDLTFTNLPANGWVKHGNYYYYTQSVSAGAITPELFTSAAVKAGAAPAGCTMDLQVLAQAIQAAPRDAVIAAWGLDPTALKN
ncbi:MAG: hypothetical protein SOT89_08360 [Clostridiaceae bacterium]|nr:hypothetical protein [Clostridiaceae bacterium]